MQIGSDLGDRDGVPDAAQLELDLPTGLVLQLYRERLDKEGVDWRSTPQVAGPNLDFAKETPIEVVPLDVELPATMVELERLAQPELVEVPADEVAALGDRAIRSLGRAPECIEQRRRRERHVAREHELAARAAYATPSPWFPADAVTTPRSRASPGIAASARRDPR